MNNNHLTPARPSQRELRRAEAATWGAPPANNRHARRAEMKIRRFAPYENDARTMRGFIDVQTPSGLILLGWKLMVGPTGAYWLAAPSANVLDADGTPKRDNRGKPIWADQIGFIDGCTRSKFTESVLAALRLSNPELFSGECTA
jgi:hypothetical protein